MSKITSDFRQRDGVSPAHCDHLIIYAAGRIAAASKRGVGLRLSAAEVRALDWAVIRTEGDVDKGGWLESDFAGRQALQEGKEE